MGNPGGLDDLDALLADAEVLREEYADYDAAASRRRIAEDLTRLRSGDGEVGEIESWLARIRLADRHYTQSDIDAGLARVTERVRRRWQSAP